MRAELTPDVELALARERAVLDAVYVPDTERMTELMSADGFAVDATLGCVSQRTCMRRIVALEPGARFEIEDLELLHADEHLVVVVYRLCQEGRFEGAPLPPVVHSTSAWAPEEGTWKAIFHHETVARGVSGGVEPVSTVTVERDGAAIHEDVVARERRLLRAASEDAVDFDRLVAPEATFVGADGRVGAAELGHALARVSVAAAEVTALAALAPAPHAVILIYGFADLPVYCSSIWLERSDGWQLICHQQA